MYKILFLCAVIICTPLFAEAGYLSTSYTHPVFTNNNWSTVPHPVVESFSLLQDGSFSGVTTNGISFRQYTVPNSVGMRIQRFEIQDHYHYIVEGDVVYSFEALSRRLATAFIQNYSMLSV